ncbi:MAG: hypothetical protein JWM65_1103 [Sphingomonas bacterium]|nr:hypothetical protein [Sphingomonas bacterium]
MLRRFATPMILTLLSATPALAQRAPDDARVGFLYSYEVRDPAAFEKGYRAHLDWHRKIGDRLAWYGWHVVAGDRIGQFVDGTFGATLAEIDARPALSEDGANFAQTTAPYVHASRQMVLSLLPGASGSTLLEDRQPAGFLDVYFVDVDPAKAGAFEKALIAHRASARGSWYRAILGGRLPSYILMVPRTSWTDLAAGGGRPVTLAGAPPWLGGFVTGIRSEVWRYAADLSNVPAR